MWNLLYLAAENITITTVNKMAFSCENNCLFFFEELPIQYKWTGYIYEINKNLPSFACHNS